LPALPAPALSLPAQRVAPRPVDPRLRAGWKQAIEKYGPEVARKLVTPVWCSDEEWAQLLKEVYP